MIRAVKYARFCALMTMIGYLALVWLCGWRGVLALGPIWFALGWGYFAGKAEMAKVACQEMDKIKACVENLRPKHPAFAERIEDRIKNDARFRQGIENYISRSGTGGIS
jgi:hypothetical protein